MTNRMLSLAEAADDVSLRLVSATVSSVDAGGAGFDFGAIPRKRTKGTQTVEKPTSGHCA
jgi:hypothetical protein